MIVKLLIQSFLQTAKASLGDVIYKYITSENFSPESLLASLDISSEHEAIKIANRVEAAIYIWHKKTNLKAAKRATRSSSRSSWGKFKSEMFMERGESLLFSLKQHFPFLPQTSLDVSKIQCNKVCNFFFPSFSIIFFCLTYDFFPFIFNKSTKLVIQFLKYDILPYVFFEIFLNPLK
jgi:hypothetical protein